MAYILLDDIYGLLRQHRLERAMVDYLDCLFLEPWLTHLLKVSLGKLYRFLFVFKVVDLLFQETLCSLLRLVYRVRGDFYFYFLLYIGLIYKVDILFKLGVLIKPLAQVHSLELELRLFLFVLTLGEVGSAFETWFAWLVFFI